MIALFSIRYGKYVSFGVVAGATCADPTIPFLPEVMEASMKFFLKIESAESNHKVNQYFATQKRRANNHRGS